MKKSTDPNSGYNHNYLDINDSVYFAYCPNCQLNGDFLQDINEIMKNCIDFCEFPHKCYVQNKGGSIVWKTMLDLQDHARYECPQFGCDICYLSQFQHMTRAQLF